MSEVKTRKAVVTIADVQAAFADYVAVRKMMGEDLSGHTFDRGARGKGFAQYDKDDNLVRSFDGKDDALTHYGRYAEIAREVMDAFSIRPAETNAEASEETEGTSGTPDVENAPEGPAEAAAPAPRQRRKAGSNA